MVNTKDITKVSLAQFLSFYKEPISEEQAWAICFHCCCKMNQILAQGLDSVEQMKIPDIDELYIHSDGSLSFTIKHNYGKKLQLKLLKWWFLSIYKYVFLQFLISLSIMSYLN